MNLLYFWNFMIVWKYVVSYADSWMTASIVLYFSTEYHNSRQNIIKWKYFVDIRSEAWLNLFLGIHKWKNACSVRLNKQFRYKSHLFTRILSLQEGWALRGEQDGLHRGVPMGCSRSSHLPQEHSGHYWSFIHLKGTLTVRSLVKPKPELLVRIRNFWPI